MNYHQIMANVLREESRALEAASVRIEVKTSEKLALLFDDLIDKKSNLIFCGVGKSGLVGKKLAATFTSLGLPSTFLHPTEALHGDLGILRESDSIVFLSYSGTTEEIKKLIPFLVIDKSRRIGLVGNTDSFIAHECEIVFDCSIEKEACKNNQAPTTSSTLAMAMGDAMAVLFEHQTGISREGFAKFHPGGKLGKSLSLKVEHLLIPKENCPVLHVNQSLREAISAMSLYPVGAACIVEKNQFKGLIVDGDIRRFLSSNDFDLDKNVGHIMNTNPISVSKNVLAIEALKMMEDRERPISVLPVLEGTKLVGVLRLHDLFKEGL